MRHGQKSPKKSGSKDFDVVLSDFGHQQAQKVGEFFGKTYENREVEIFASPYPRALQTGEPTFLALGMQKKVKMEWGISENTRNGAFEKGDLKAIDEWWNKWSDSSYSPQFE